MANNISKMIVALGLVLLVSSFAFRPAIIEIKAYALEALVAGKTAQECNKQCKHVPCKQGSCTSYTTEAECEAATNIIWNVSSRYICDDKTDETCQRDDLKNCGNKADCYWNGVSGQCWTSQYGQDGMSGYQTCAAAIP